jgi:hypothetical protein
MSFISPDLRQLVVRRAGNRCEYCQLSQDCQVATFPIDHVAPRALGGPTTPENLALTCPRCNALKWKWQDCRDPVTGTTVPLFNPRTQVWTEHFQWSATDPVVLLGITPAGRGAIELLELNGHPHLAVRRLLVAVGTHPPGSTTR